MMDLYRILDNDETVLAGRKFHFMEVFLEETGHKVEEFKDKPKEFARILDEYPEARRWFNKMMEMQRKVGAYHPSTSFI